MGIRAVVDIDDFGPGTALENLLKIKEHYPKFKVTALMIPGNISLFTGDLTMDKYKEWAAIVKENLDWIEICPHGFGHIKGEMLLASKKEAKMLIKAAENMLKYLGLPFTKVWKSPYWQTSEAAYKVLRDMGYTVMVDRNQPRPEIKDLKTYFYNWSIDEPMPKGSLIKAHGHFYGTNNDIALCMPNLFSLPPDTEFLKISEYLELYGKNSGSN